MTGRFRGVNLFGDLPQAPGRSRYDFVLQSADAALWVTGLQPKGKSFSLDRNARVDTGRWLEVTGIVGRSAGLVWIDGEKIGLGTAPEPAAVVQIEVPKVGPAPDVTFSIPTPEDIDVETSILVRIQFSRDMEAASFKDRVRVRTSRRRPRGPTSPPPLSTAYREGTKVLEITLRSSRSLPDSGNRAPGRHRCVRQREARDALEAHVHDGRAITGDGSRKRFLNSRQIVAANTAISSSRTAVMASATSGHFIKRRTRGPRRRGPR